MSKDVNVNELVLPAGQYVIADPCYLIGTGSHEQWLELCRKFFFDLDGCDIFEYKGHKFFCSSTQLGDGYYPDQYGHRYAVDAGLIACIPFVLCEINSNTRKFISDGNGDGYKYHNIYQFDKPIHCGFDGTVISIDEIDIDTTYVHPDDPTYCPMYKTQVVVGVRDTTESDKINDLAKEASVKDQYDRYVDMEFEERR